VTPRARAQKLRYRHAGDARLSSATRAGWCLSDEEAASLLLEPCWFCGEEPVFPRRLGYIDRHDPSQPFSLQNCIATCSQCHSLSKHCSPPEVVALCRAIVVRRGSTMT